MSRQKPVEIFMPPNTLKAKIGGSMPALDDAAIKRAEEAIQALSGQFGAWLEEEIDALQAARHALKANGMTKATIDSFHTRAHDLKGQGTTYQFPFVTEIAGSLCKLLENLPEPAALPLALVDAHVDAIRAVVRQNIKTHDHPVGAVLLKELSARVNDSVKSWQPAEDKA